MRIMSEFVKVFWVGLIGIGCISDIYFKNIKGFLDIEIVVCGSFDMVESCCKVVEYGVLCVLMFDEIIVDLDIDVVLNLIILVVYVYISFVVLEVGKYVYFEKLFVIDILDG